MKIDDLIKILNKYDKNYDVIFNFNYVDYDDTYSTREINIDKMDGEIHIFIN